MDKNYWRKFYNQHGHDRDIIQQSSFASFCQNDFFNNKQLNIIELGSGNGRDAMFFLRYNHNIIALDQSTDILEEKKNKLAKNDKKKITIKNVDFVTENYEKYDNVDVFYSRFTIHSINKEEEIVLVSKIYNNLKDGGLFCVEVRTTKDALFGTGEQLSDSEYYTDHYRRFIDSNIFLRKMMDLNFKLRYFTEKDNLSIYKNDNPVLMRIVLEK